jgi:hypothetical protein
MAETTHTYDELRVALAGALEAAAAAQEAGLLGNIGADYDKFDALIPRDSDPRNRKLSVTLMFWDFWIDSSNHDWFHYPGMTASSWPLLARGIADDLRTNRDIASEQVVRLVEPRPRTPRKWGTLLRRVLSWARR